MGLTIGSSLDSAFMSILSSEDPIDVKKLHLQGFNTALYAIRKMDLAPREQMELVTLLGRVHETINMFSTMSRAKAN